MSEKQPLWSDNQIREDLDMMVASIAAKAYAFALAVVMRDDYERKLAALQEAQRGDDAE